MHTPAVRACRHWPPRGGLDQTHLESWAQPLTLSTYGPAGLGHSSHSRRFQPSVPRLFCLDLTTWGCMLMT